MNLRLLQLGDSALPIGGYSHSWGLEAAVERGLVTDPASLERWVLHWLRYSFGPMEGVVVGAVARAVVESMACGCALVSTANGGSSDYAVDGETALVCGSDPAEMSEAVARLVRDERDLEHDARGIRAEILNRAPREADP